VSQKSFKAMAECFVVKAKAAKISGDARYGLIVSKRDFKLAVHRNRAKRLMRDWIAFNEDLMSPELDYVFIAYSQVLDCGREVGRKSMADALVKIAELNENAKQAQ
jgi:ribonuclease P protein component